MLNKLFNTLKEFIQTHDRKKIIEYCTILGIIGVIIIVAGGSLFGGNSKNHKANLSPKKQSRNSEIQETPVISKSGEINCSEIEKNIEEILSKIKGVGKVNVMITYSCSKQSVHAYDIKKSSTDTDEKDSGGGTRKNIQESYESKLVYEDSQNGSKKPVVIKESLPEIRGIVVVADGASDINIKEHLGKAVQALTDIPIHKIQVFERV